MTTTITTKEQLANLLIANEARLREAEGPKAVAIAKATQNGTAQACSILMGYSPWHYEYETQAAFTRTIDSMGPCPSQTTPRRTEWFAQVQRDLISTLWGES